MTNSVYSKGVALLLATGVLASCGSEGTDNRFANADVAPTVLIRDLDVYRLVGDEEYVRIPISDDLSESDAQKYFTATADNLAFDVAAYYRNGYIYYKITSSISRDSEGNLVSADASAMESAVDKTSSLFFRLGFQTEIDGREVTMPITGMTVEPSGYTRLGGGRNAAGREQIMLEWVGTIADVPPSMFLRMNSLDVTWVDAEQSADAAAAVAPTSYEEPAVAVEEYAEAVDASEYDAASKPAF